MSFAHSEKPIFETINFVSKFDVGTSHVGSAKLAHIPVDYVRLVMTKNFQKLMHTKCTGKNRIKFLIPAGTVKKG